MFEAMIVTEFNSAHRLRNYNGKCENLHGHNWRVEVLVCSPELDRNGFVVDFVKLKKITNTFIKNLDHKVLNGTPFFKKINPSAENIAQLIYNNVKKKLPKSCSMSSVSVWETNANCATYREE
ncbi:MAG: 6-carboxytetrahydropterin synthase QueD [Candidatus Ancaeobacter aquaticus]|nr:6-carboxytetrahydropterin synthase QueD [Candidatus Ancaeobacter aquaticus]